MRLLRLTIDDFGLIAHASFAFADGLTVFSGETGSGKTMLLGALGFALGERGEPDLVRTGAARARVTLEIEPDGALHERLAGAGFAIDDDDDVIVARELSAAGRSQARINGIPASASQLRALAGSLADVVGQHEAQRLLAPGYALEVVDRFGGPALPAARETIRRGHAELQAVRAERAELAADDGRALAQLEFARFALADIAAARLDEGEDERLRERRDVLANAEKIALALSSAHAALAGEGAAVDAAGAAAGAVEAIARYGAPYAEVARMLAALQSDAAECAARLAREREGVELDPAELDAVTARLDAIERLKKKYGGSIAAVHAMRDEFEQTLARDASRDGRLADLTARERTLEAALGAEASRLTALRSAAAAELERAVAAELAELAMPAARFAVVFEPLAAVGPSGAERAELRLAPNPGEPQRPLAKSASGGELSRVLLALVVVLADRRDRTALIFDEVDAGIGGTTAVAVAGRLGRLARSTQVLVVTHLAQIASWADRQYALRKRETGGATLVELEDLEGRDARLAEIARMLSGEANAVSLRHAATLVAGARAS